MALLQPKEITIETEQGPRTYLLHKFPAIAGREIVTQYPATAMPKVGDYATNEALMLKVMSFVCAVPGEGEPIQLTTRALVDNQVPDFETLIKLEWAMMEYNCSFFRNGNLTGLLERAVKALPDVLSQTLTALQARSSGKGSPPSTS